MPARFVKIEVMAISPKLLEMLACPICKTDVQLDSDQSALRCTSCQRVFPILEGIPVMFVDRESSSQDSNS